MLLCNLTWRLIHLEGAQLETLALKAANNLTCRDKAFVPCSPSQISTAHQCPCIIALLLGIPDLSISLLSINKQYKMLPLERYSTLAGLHNVQEFTVTLTYKTPLDTIRLDLWHTHVYAHIDAKAQVQS